MNLVKLDDLLTRHGLTRQDFDDLTERYGYPALCSQQGEIVCDSGEFAGWFVEVKRHAGCDGCDE